MNKELISANIPSLSPSDTIGRALSLMEDLRLSHLPLVHDGKYIGLLFEETLLAENDLLALSHLPHPPKKIAVQANTHCLEAIKTANELAIQVVPVMSEGDHYEGAIPAIDLLLTWGKLTGVEEPGGLIVLETDMRNFAFAEIAKIIESNDAQIRQLNTAVDSQNECITITLKINKFEISDLIASLQRYGYRIKYYFGEELYENELRSNYDHLMNYLNI